MGAPEPAGAALEASYKIPIRVSKALLSPKQAFVLPWVFTCGTKHTRCKNDSDRENVMDPIDVGGS